MTKSHDHTVHIKNKFLDFVNNFRIFQTPSNKFGDPPITPDISRRQKGKYINSKDNNIKHGRNSLRESIRICSDSNPHGVHSKYNSINND